MRLLRRLRSLAPRLPHALDKAPGPLCIDILGPTESPAKPCSAGHAYCERRKLQLKAVRLAPLQESRLGVRQRARDAGRHSLALRQQGDGYLNKNFASQYRHPGRGQQFLTNRTMRRMPGGCLGTLPWLGYTSATYTSYKTGISKHKLSRRACRHRGGPSSCWVFRV